MMYVGNLLLTITVKKSIVKLVSQTENTIHIIPTFRLHIRKTKQFEKFIQVFKIKECDLLSDEFALDLNEKRKIGLCHLNQEYIYLIGDEVIFETNSFPLLCKLSSGTKFNPDFFLKPYHIYKEKFDEMATNNKECFCWPCFPSSVKQQFKDMLI